jgi:hypothetical protein
VSSQETINNTLNSQLRLLPPSPQIIMLPMTTTTSIMENS